jgi:hypothetical protein
MTNKAILFVDYYISNNFNATQAAESAGYSKKTAYSQGQRLLNNVEIKERLNKRIGELLSDTEKASMKLINTLDEIVDSDMGVYANVVTETYWNKNTRKEEKRKNIVYEDTADLNTRLISEISQSKDGHIKIKFYDKLKAVEMKGKFLELWQDGLSPFKQESKEEKLTREERKEEILRLNKELGLNK